VATIAAGLADAVEAGFHALNGDHRMYDRRRFGGPVSRDRLITAVRERFPRA
jgi:hypothetical protein